MVVFAGIGQQTAQGISLLAMIPASTVGALTHWQKGNIRTSRMPGLVVGVLAGSLSVGALRTTYQKGNWVSSIRRSSSTRLSGTCG